MMQARREAWARALAVHMEMLNPGFALSRRRGVAFAAGVGLKWALTLLVAALAWEVTL